MPIKIIHTSDWHLGKKLFKKERLEEQKLFIKWLIDYICENKIDILLIAGDIFDTPQPPHDALKLYYDFIAKLTDKSDCTIYLIGGNHDGPKLISAPTSLYDESRVFLSSTLHAEENKKFEISNHVHLFEKEGEKVAITLLPYFRNYEIFNLAKELFPNEQEEKSEELYKKTLEFFFKEASSLYTDATNILVAHHLFGSFQLSGSEQGLSLSGIESIPLTMIKDHYKYTALGHIHRPQILLKEPQVRYSGPPLPYRFSEEGEKSIELLEVKEDELEVQRVLIPKKRKLYSLELTYADLFDQIDIAISESSSFELSSYLEINLQLESPRSGVADEVREYLKKSQAKIELISFHYRIKKENQVAKKSDFNVNKLSIKDLFNKFYLTKFSDQTEIPKEIVEDFNELLIEVTRSEN